MRKLVHIISAAILSVAFIGTAASAQQAPAACNGVIVVNSGNGNKVTVNCTDVNTVTVTCENNVYVGNINYQNGQSGDAQTGPGSGTATSGNVTNANNTTTQLGTSCGETTTPSPAPGPSNSPSPSVSPQPSVKPTVLPNTAGTSAESVVIASLAAAAFIVIASRIAVAAYRHRSTK